MHKLEGHTRSAAAVAFSPNSRTLASGSFDKTLRLWDVAAGTETRKLEGHTEVVNSVAFSPDGQVLASGSKDATIRLWNVAGGTEIRKLEGHTDNITSVVFSPSGQTLVSGSTDETVRLWSPTGDPLLVLRANRDHNASYVFTPGATPLIEFLGPEAEQAAQYPVCRVGPLTLFFDICRERYEVPGLFRKVLAGDASYTDP